MRRTRMILAAIVALGTLLFGVPTAAGATPDAPPPEPRVDPDTQLVAEVTISPAPAQRIATPADVGQASCWTQRWNGSARAAAGNTLYTFYTVGGWCYSGSTVTDAWLADAGGETSTPGWRYEGVTGSGAGVVGNEGRSYARHQFVLGVGGIDIQHPVECLRVRGRVGPASIGEYVCGIY